MEGGGRMKKGYLTVWGKIGRFGPVIVVMIVLILGLVLYEGKQHVLAVTIDSEPIGYVKREEDVKVIVNGLINQAKAGSEQEIKIAQEIKFSKVKQSFDQLTAPEELKQTLSERLTFLGIGYQLLVGDRELVWVRDRDEGTAVLEEIKRLSRESLEQKGKVQVEEVLIKETVDGKTGFCSLEEIKTVEEAVAVSLPHLTVLTTEKITISEEIPYSTQTVEDQELWSGVKQVKRQGRSGMKELTMLVKRENGKMLKEIVLNEKVVREPITQVVSRGTRSLPARGTGRFSWPVQGEITSFYGLRRGRMHQGIDIAAETGTGVVAAEEGVVTEAGWRNGYGYTVIINHGGDLTTLYAHNSRLLVSEGDSVSRGQMISRVGSTGSSTGPHLHFEVRSAGRTIDPLSCFN
jgi:murein DD-endopeptidase MepM/ murein hydrolase activator NlpD